MFINLSDIYYFIQAGKTFKIRWYFMVFHDKFCQNFLSGFIYVPVHVAVLALVFGWS